MEFTSANIKREYIYTSIVPVVLLFGITLSVVSFIEIRKSEFQRISLRFEIESESRYATIKREIESDLQTVDAMDAFYDANNEVDRLKFKLFAEDLLENHVSIQALAWIPRVLSSNRKEYEKSAKNEGFPDFRITERSKQGTIVSAGERKEYFPVYFVAPLKGNEIAFGFDLASNPERLEAIERSRDTGEMVATAKIKLLPEKAGQYGFLVFKPVYKIGALTDTVVNRRDNLKGFVIGAFRTIKIVEKSLSYLKPSGIDIYIYDKPVIDESALIYYHTSRKRKVSAKDNVRKDNMHMDMGFISHKNLTYTKTLFVAGRKWLVMCKPVPGYIEDKYSFQSWAIPFAGLVLTFIVTGYLVSIKRKTKTIRRLVSDLETSNEHLQEVIWELRQTEEKVRKAQEMLIHSEKMAALGELSAGVAHEIRNPLNVISTSTQILMMEDNIGEETMEAYNVIIEQVDRAAKIVDNLLEFARKSTIEIRKLELNELIEKMAALVLYEMKAENIEIIVNFRRATIFINGDRDQLAQVLLNIINNARDGIKEKQSTHSHAEPTEDVWSGCLRIDTWADPEHVYVSFEDNGIGIPEAIINNIFDPFFTTKQEGKGSGLGLSISYGIIKNHDGDIKVQSGNGKTVFTLIFPAIKTETLTETLMETLTDGLSADNERR